MPSNNKSNRTTFWMALLAIIISLVGTIVSIIEANILRDQQVLMLEEKAASVWPYLEVSVNVDFDPTGINVQYAIVNKGVGPALLSNLEHSVKGGVKGTLLEALEALRNANPGVKIIPTLSSTSSNSVIAAEESKVIYRLRATTPQGSSPLEFITLNEKIKTHFCYCSIYGDCWDSENIPLTKEEACMARDLLKKAD